MRLGELAARLDCQLDGDSEVEVVRVTSLDAATSGDVALCAQPKFVAALARTNASAVILAPDMPAPPCAALRTHSPYLAFARALSALMAPPRPAPGVHPSAVVADTAILGRDVTIGAFVVVGARTRVGDRTTIAANTTIGDDVVIGEDCTIHSNVAIRERVTIGSRVILQNSAVVGTDGFGFARRPDGSHEKIPQLATVVIEDDVELGAHSAVDRPALGETRIRRGTKIDNLVQVGHGVSVGEHVLMSAQVGIAGSCVIEDGVVLGGQAGVADHLTLRKGSVAAAQSGVTHHIEAGTIVAGYPAIEIHAWRRSSVIFRRLPELKKQIEALEARLRTLEEHKE